MVSQGFLVVVEGVLFRSDLEIIRNRLPGHSSRYLIKKLESGEAFEMSEVELFIAVFTRFEYNTRNA